jgi:hypothetical protein
MPRIPFEDPEVRKVSWVIVLALLVFVGVQAWLWILVNRLSP